MPCQQQFVQTASLISDTAQKLQSKGNKQHQNHSCTLSSFFLFWSREAAEPHLGWSVAGSSWSSRLLSHVTQKNRLNLCRVAFLVAGSKFGLSVELLWSVAVATDRKRSALLLLPKIVYGAKTSHSYSIAPSFPLCLLNQQSRAHPEVRGVWSLPTVFHVSASRRLSVPAKRQTRTCCKLFQQSPPQFNPTDTGPSNHSFVSSQGKHADKLRVPNVSLS